MSFLGKGEEQKDIIETSNRLGIKDKVIYRFEFIPEDEKYYIMLPQMSVYFSQFTNHLARAAMEKLIVVGSREVVGFREQVIISDPHQNGIHINGEDPGDIAWGIKEYSKTCKEQRFGQE